MIIFLREFGVGCDECFHLLVIVGSDMFFSHVVGVGSDMFLSHVVLFCIGPFLIIRVLVNNVPLC